MISPEGRTQQGMASAADQDLVDLYSEVMGELMQRHREQHRDHWGSEQPAPTALAATDDAELRHVYRLVHDEMMARHEGPPGTRQLRDDAPGAA